MTVLLAFSVALLHQLLRLDRGQRDRLVRIPVGFELDRAFRDDVHRASRPPVVEPAKLSLILHDGTEVRYVAEADQVQRVRERKGQPPHRERYLLPHGKPAVAGDVIRQPELGKTLRAIAAKGRDAFYSGEIAADMVETLRGIGGLHTLEDFAAHSTETTAPIGTMYKGHDVWQCPPNGPGIGLTFDVEAVKRHRCE